MATIVADDALAEAAGAPIDVDMLEIKVTALSIRFSFHLLGIFENEHLGDIIIKVQVLKG